MPKCDFNKVILIPPSNLSAVTPLKSSLDRHCTNYEIFHWKILTKEKHLLKISLTENFIFLRYARTIFFVAV